MGSGFSVAYVARLACRPYPHPLPDPIPTHIQQATPPDAAPAFPWPTPTSFSISPYGIRKFGIRFTPSAPPFRYPHIPAPQKRNLGPSQLRRRPSPSAGHTPIWPCIPAHPPCRHLPEHAVEAHAAHAAHAAYPRHDPCRLRRAHRSPSKQAEHRISTSASSCGVLFI